MARRNKPFTFSMPIDLYEQVQVEAAKNGKSTSGLIAEIISAGLSGSVKDSPRLAIKSRLAAMLNLVSEHSSLGEELRDELLGDLDELDRLVRAWYGQNFQHDTKGEKAATSEPDELTEDEINEIFG